MSAGSRVPDSVPLPPDPPVPDPPPDPDFLSCSWEAGRELARCGPRSHAVHQPYVSPRPYRFSPVVAKASRGARPVATLYAGANVRAAIAETVFHDVPVRGEHRTVLYERFENRILGRVIPRRSLKLADFTSDGLSRVGVLPTEITETGPATYLRTAAWAQAVFDHAEDFDGIFWMSRLRDSGPAVMLFDRRVRAADLSHQRSRDVASLTAPGPLDVLIDYANDLGIQIAGLPWQRH